MDDIVKMYLAESQEKMNGAINHFMTELGSIRAGKANAHILSGIYIDYYGTKTALNQMANISIPDARSIIIQPWDKTAIDSIEREIQKANLGINPQNDGQIIRLNIPPLTEERRKTLVKQVNGEGEMAKVAIRNIRRDINEDLKKLKKEGISEDDIKEAENQVQKMTDHYVKKIDEVMVLKEKDIMTV
ncbi:MAG: ribosome recycling factor [Bacteroidia bacterium]|nr:ribosome recycling factor [Bacteroidia bacterium]